MRALQWTLMGMLFLVGCSTTRAEPSAAAAKSSARRADTPAAAAPRPPPPCAPGDRRWCAGSAHGGFGIATCDAGGRWTECVEGTSGPNGPLDRPDTTCACRYPSFDARCCEDQQDRDGDGRQDCIVPDAHEAPDCGTDGALGAYCDADSECQTASNDGLCLLADDGTHVYSFCSRPCSDAQACPEGWACVSVAASGRPTTSHCFPSSARPNGVLQVSTR